MMTPQEEAIEQAVTEAKREFNALAHAFCECLAAEGDIAQAGGVHPDALLAERDTLLADLLRVFLDKRRLEETCREIAAGRKRLTGVEHAALMEAQERAKAEKQARKQDRVAQAERVRRARQEALDAAHRNPGEPPPVPVAETRLQRIVNAQLGSGWGARIDA